MIPMVAAEDLADFIDVFCDKGFFTVEETDRMLMAVSNMDCSLKFMPTNWIIPVVFKWE